MQNVGSSIAIWNISLRFFSPPEKPSFTERLISFWSISTSCRFSFIILIKSAGLIGSSPLDLRFAFTAALMKLVIDTPGISTGIWNDMNMPALARSSGVIASRSSPLKVIVPSVTSYAGLPTITLLNVLFPAPLVPISA